MKTPITLEISPQVPQPVRELLAMAFKLGWIRSERENYRAGWAWGMVCGITLGCTVMALALKLGAAS